MSIKDPTYKIQHIYPVSWYLMGESYAQEIASLFIQQELYLKDFPHFLEKFPPLKSFSYLGDVARLEWIQHQSFLAPSQSALLNHQLNFFLEEIPPLRFIAHPSLALFASPYPLEKIWNLSQSSEKINLSAESSWALIIRPQSTVETYWLTCEAYTFFESLVEGNNLTQSLEKTLSFCPDFNFQEALQLAFVKNFFIGVYLSFPKDETLLSQFPPYA